MKAWITKYALTSGILEMEGEVVEKFTSMFRSNIDAGEFQQFFHKPYWHPSREAAVVHANELKERKIKSIEKSLSKLRKTTFQ